MREKLFRGMRKDNGEWVEGFLFQTKEHTYIAYAEQFDDDLFLSPKNIFIEVIPETVGQFICLTANGKKIFEGDVGKYKQVDGAKRKGKSIICRGSVVYNAKTASYAVESKDEAGCKYFDYFPIKDFEVIGNIHDKPELLKGGGSDA